jgi:antirestriction protein ArdC
MKGYTVFNIEQIDGLPERYYARPASRIETVLRIEHTESFFAANGAAVHHSGNQACYIPSVDHIRMPPIGGSATPRAITPPSPMRPIMP